MTLKFIKKILTDTPRGYILRNVDIPPGGISHNGYFKPCEHAAEWINSSGNNAFFDTVRKCLMVHFAHATRSQIKNCA